MVSLGFEALSLYSWGWWQMVWVLEAAQTLAKTVLKASWQHYSLPLEHDSHALCKYSVLLLKPWRKRVEYKKFCCRLSFFCQFWLRDILCLTWACKNTYSLKQKAHTNTKIKMHMHKPKQIPENKAIILFLWNQSVDMNIFLIWNTKQPSHS